MNRYHRFLKVIFNKRSFENTILHSCNTLHIHILFFTVHYIDRNYNITHQRLIFINGREHPTIFWKMILSYFA